MFENFTAVLADTRVGSTALGTGLDNGATTFFLGEILYPEVVESHRHLYKSVLGLDLAKVLRDENEVHSLLDRFFSSDEWSDEAHYFFDIKYHDLGIFPRHPGALGARPILLDYLVSRRFRIIHLNRRSKLGATLSQEVAIATGLFHSNQERDVRQGDIELPIGQVIANVMGREQSHQSVKNWLRGYENVLDIEYEALFLDQPRFDIAAFMRDRWGIREASFAPKLSRLSGSSRVQIANADEIESRLAQLCVGGDIATALAPYRNQRPSL